MKLTTQKVSFLKALQIASKAVNPKAIIPLYQNILLEVDGDNVRLTSTNFEMSIRVILENSTGDKFRTAIPAKLTTDFVNTLQDDKINIVFDIKTQAMSVKTKHSKNTIKCVEASDFEQAPKIEKSLLKVNALDLKQAVVRTSFCSATTEDKPVLTGVYFVVDDGKLTLTAVDGFRLAMNTIPIPKKYTKKRADAIIKASTLDIVSRILDEEGDISIEIRDTQVLFNSENVFISVQRIDGNYPDVTPLLEMVQKPNTTITPSTLQFLRTCKQVELFTAENNAVKCLVDNKSVELSALSKEKGESRATVDANVKGKPIEIGINISYLKQFLEICNTEQHLVQFISSDKPVLFRMQDDDSFNYIILPVVL